MYVRSLHKKCTIRKKKKKLIPSLLEIISFVFINKYECMHIDSIIVLKLKSKTRNM
jgi:hypothetical protein